MTGRCAERARGSEQQIAHPRAEGVSGRALGLCAALAVVFSLWPSAARAWSCTRTGDSSSCTGACSSGPSLAWFKREVPYTFYADGTRFIPGDLEFDVLRASFTHWQAVQGCADPSAYDDIIFSETDWMSYVDRIGYDFAHPGQNENLLIFRDGGWPIPGQSDIIALTTTTYKPLTGEIVDADIEFNTADFPFSADAGPGEMDLMNAAVHEMGHVLGLAHSTVPGATMEATGQLGETQKRTLECDDRDAIVFKYPAGKPNGYCDPAPNCGYCAAPSPLSSQPTVTVDDRDSHISGCAAGGDEPLWIPPYLTLVVVVGRLRRKRTSAGV